MNAPTAGLLLPGQLSRLRAQVMAYRHLSRNMAVPPEVLLEAGPPGPIFYPSDYPPAEAAEYENVPTTSDFPDDATMTSSTTSSAAGLTYVDPYFRRTQRGREYLRDTGIASLLGNHVPPVNGPAPAPGRHGTDVVGTFLNAAREERVRAKVRYRVEELLAVAPQLPSGTPSRKRADNELKSLRLLDFQKRVRYQIAQGATSLFLLEAGFDSETFRPSLPFGAASGLRMCYEPGLPVLHSSSRREQSYKVFLGAVLERSAQMCQARRAKNVARAKMCAAVIAARMPSEESVHDAYVRLAAAVEVPKSDNDKENSSSKFRINVTDNDVVCGDGDDVSSDSEDDDDNDLIAQNIAINLQSFQLDGIKWLQKMHSRGLSCAVADDKSLVAMSYVACFVTNTARSVPGMRFLIITESIAVNEWFHYLTHFAPNVATVVYDGAAAVRHEVYRRYVAPSAPTREPAAVITTAHLGFGELALDTWTAAIIDEGFSAGLRGPLFDQTAVTLLPNTQSKILFLRYAWPSPGCELKLFHFVCNSNVQQHPAVGDGHSSSNSYSTDENMLGETPDESTIATFINKHFVLRRDINDVRGLISDRFYTVIRCKMSYLHQLMYHDTCEYAFNVIEVKRAAEESREPPKAHQRLFDIRPIDSSPLARLQTICTHPFVLLDQYSLNDTVIRASGKFYALDQILNKVGSFDNVHRFAIYTRKHNITRILQSYLKLRGIGFMELRDPADIASDVIDPNNSLAGEQPFGLGTAGPHGPSDNTTSNPRIPSIPTVVNMWNTYSNTKCVLLCSIDTDEVPLVRTDTAIFLDPDWAPKVSTSMAFPDIGYDNSNPANPYYSLKIFHLVTAYSVEENMLIAASSSTNGSTQGQAMADPDTFDNACDNKTKQSILEAYLFKCSSLKELEHDQKELPLAVPGPLFNYALARDSDELLAFNHFDQSMPSSALLTLLSEEEMSGSAEGAVQQDGPAAATAAVGGPGSQVMAASAAGIATDPTQLVGTVSGQQITSVDGALMMGDIPFQDSIVTGANKKVKRKATRSIAAIFRNPRNVPTATVSIASTVPNTIWKQPWNERECKW